MGDDEVGDLHADTNVHSWLLGRARLASNSTVEARPEALLAVAGATCSIISTHQAPVRVLVEVSTPGKLDICETCRPLASSCKDDVSSVWYGACGPTLRLGSTAVLPPWRPGEQVSRETDPIGKFAGKIGHRRQRLDESARPRMAGLSIACSAGGSLLRGAAGNERKQLLSRQSSTNSYPALVTFPASLVDIECGRVGFLAAV